jgi:hypothetical protein
LFSCTTCGRTRHSRGTYRRIAIASSSYTTNSHLSGSKPTDRTLNSISSKMEGLRPGTVPAAKEPSGTAASGIPWRFAGRKDTEWLPLVPRHHLPTAYAAAL